jgi:eukaryotic-like serine/threonine-protein kinase
MKLLANVRALLGGRKVDIQSRFALERLSICGTMSTVYKAYDRHRERIVALKVLDPEKTAAFELLFRHLPKPSEGAIASMLAHENIVRTLEYGVTTDGRQYLVMEYLDGPGVNSLIIGRSAMLAGRALGLIRGAAEGLAALHRAGFVHRDVCPRNFIAADDLEWVKLIDFGLSHPAEPRFFQRANRTGVPRYLAPEVVRMRTVDHRADVFAFGVTAYEICTFEHPWPMSDTSGAAALDHDTFPPVDIRQHCPDIDPALADAITACLSVNPGDRPESMEQFLRMIVGAQQW